LLYFSFALAPLRKKKTIELFRAAGLNK